MFVVFVVVRRLLIVVLGLVFDVDVVIVVVCDVVVDVGCR